MITIYQPAAVRGGRAKERRGGNHSPVEPIMCVSEEFPLSVYEEIGANYTTTRRADPRIAEQIHAALGSASSVVNVGAGAGAYEPCDRKVLPIEPSKRMIAQRPPDLPLAIRGHAECLPLPSDCVDAAMACMTLHHWPDWRIGVQELRRVARERVVIFTYDRSYSEHFWLLRDYLPRLGRVDSQRFPALEEQSAALGEEVNVVPVPIAHDCEDGFLGAYWRRPHAYLDKQVRAGISTFHLVDAAGTLDGLDGLAEDLDSGRWEERYHDLLERDQLDLGYRLLVTEL